MTVETSTSTVPQRFDVTAASAAVDAALQAAGARGLAPMSIVALDVGENLVAAKRKDRSGIIRFEAAFGKAWGSLGACLIEGIKLAGLIRNPPHKEQA